MAHTPGARYDLADLLGLGEAITNYYRQEGYPFAYAFLPAQEVSDGTLIIKVIEGRYGSIATSCSAELAGPGPVTVLFRSLALLLCSFSFESQWAFPT
jgi:hypothetical protein